MTDDNHPARYSLVHQHGELTKENAALRARIAKLEAALKIYAEARCSGMICAFDDGEAARAALEKKND